MFSNIQNIFKRDKQATHRTYQSSCLCDFPTRILRYWRERIKMLRYLSSVFQFASFNTSHDIKKTKQF